MSLPPQLAAKIKSIPMDPLALANNMELAYMLSFSSYNLSSDSAYCSPRDTYNSPLSDYNFVDFDEPTYQKLYVQTCKQYESKNSTTIKGIRNGFKEFYTRVAAMTYSTALKKDQAFSQPSNTTLKVPQFEAQYKIDQMRGNNPNDWPRNLAQFHQQITKLPWNAFSCQPQIYFDQFFSSAFQALKNMIKKASQAKENRNEFLKNVELIVEIILIIGLKTNNQNLILTQLQVLSNLDLDSLFEDKQKKALVSKLQNICLQIFQKIPVTEEQQYHMPKRLWEKGSAFMIMKKIHFQRQNGLGYFSVTNDGTYLYIYISSINGGMYKVGTGRNYSVPGKIYLQKQVSSPVGNKLDDVNWVYLNGKLYLKTSARQPNCIEVINADNFKVEKSIQLKCSALFGHQSLINLNRNSILMTDGKKLYFLGKQLKIAKGKQQKKEQQQKVAKQEEQSKNNKKKKQKKQKNQQPPVQVQQHNPDQIDKLLQFVLFQFDLQQQTTKQDCDQKLAEQLYMSFNSYFTLKQCRRALDLCENDLSDAAQWLVDQGERERTTKIYYPTSKVILAESEITSNFAQKNLKGSNEIVTKEGSLLHTQNVNESIWTMDEQQITCYSEAGFKIFSKSPNDIHEISQQSRLKTTHLKTVEGKFQRNPEYTISYDPYNRIFYTFTWPTDGGHYFPTAVLIGSDFKHAAELTSQKKVSMSQMQPRCFNQFSKWVLIQMNLLDNAHCPDQGRVNNWLWYFAQKIIQLNKQINSNSQADKKKLINKRSKLLTKMNKVNEYYKIYQKQKQQFEKNGKVKSQILFVPPFAADGSTQNLVKIRSIYGKQLQPSDIYGFIFGLEGWLENDLKILTLQARTQLFKIRQQLISIKTKLNPSTLKKLNHLFINYFYEFFETVSQQQDFIISLDKDQISAFVQKHHLSRHKNRKSIIYQIKNKDHLIQKYQSKSKFQQVFPLVSNIPAKQATQNSSIGNLIIQSNNENKKNKSILFSFLQKSVLASTNGIKLFEYIFLQAFRLLVRQKNFHQYANELETLFLDTFRLIENIVIQANISLLKNFSDSINQILQLYFASLCSFLPSQAIIQTLLKVLQGLHKKQIISLFNLIEDSQFQGISQISQKIYETPHPIQRGKNQSFPPLRNSEASLIYAQFDKRCQSDPNHDTLTIQTTHQNSPVGNSINCNDGVFTTNLRLTGKVDSGKPYLIMGNSVNIDFSSSGHAKDAKSFGRFGFKFGLRPIFAGKIKYKKQSIQRIQQIFGSKSEFEKYINTLKILTITLSNSIENLTYLQKQEDKNLNVQKFLSGKIFKQGYEQELSIAKATASQRDQLCIQQQIKNMLNKSKTSIQDGRLILMKSLHASNIKYQQQVNEDKARVVNQKDRKQNLQLSWNLDGMPSYIKSYVQKIKNFNGDFIDLFIQARNLAMPKGIYATQLIKSGFTQDMKRLWLQGQAILFLTVLKHSGLLHLNLKFSIQYIKANLKAFQQARNGIYQSFIRRMQSVREWRDLLQTYQGKKQVVQQKKQVKEQSQKPSTKTGIQIKKKGMATKTIKFENKDKNSKKAELKVKGQKKQQQIATKEAEKKKEAQKLIRERLTEDYMIKQICKIKSIQYIPKETFENVTRIIGKIQQESKQSQQLESVYIEPIQHLIKSCLFLLKLKSSSTKEIINQQQQNLQPENIYRSYSQDPRNVNQNKVKVFREWLQNWKKWKDFKKQGKVELKFPVSEIIQFVNSWIPLKNFTSQIELRIKLANNRMKFYQFNSILLRQTSNSFLNKYALGSEVANLKGIYNNNLQSVSSSKLSELLEKYKQYINCLNQQQDKIFKKLPLKLRQIQNLMKNDSQTIIDKLKFISLHLYLAQSENPTINLDIAMFFIPFKYFNNLCQQLIFISSLIVQRVFISKHSLQQILGQLQKQIGNDSISCKRWRDYLFIQRVLFLLMKLQNVCRCNKLDVSEKQKVAQVLFYLIYHLEIPLICRMSLRILNSLKISLNRDIITPIEKTYRIITFEEKIQKIQQFKYEINGKYNNPQLIGTKCFQAFKTELKNEIKQRMLAPFKSNIVQEDQKEDTYCIILNMCQQQDIAWMVTVLYYIEQVQNTIVPIKDWDEYISRKNKKKQHKQKEKQAQVQANQANIANQINLANQQQPSVVVEKKSKKLSDQRILLNIPNDIYNLSEQIQQNLPVGWFFNYCNIFNEVSYKSPVNAATPVIQNLPSLNQKKNKNQTQAVNPNTTRKQWNPVEYLKLYKKFEQLTSKPLEEPKEDESQQIKVQFIKAKNFISRMRKHCSQVSVIFSNLSQTGYYIFREDVPKEKCDIICQLFSLGGEYRLKAINWDFKTKDYPAKLSAAFALPTKKSELKITCIRSQQYRKFNQLMINAPAAIQVKVQNNPALYFSTLAISEYILEDKYHMPYKQFPELQASQDDAKIEFSKYFMESGLTRTQKLHDEVFLKQHPNQKYFLAQGGLQSALKQCILVPTFDQNLICQKSNLSTIESSAPKHQIVEDTQQLLEKTIKLMKQQFKEIQSKENAIPYIQLSCYLQKISAIDMRFEDSELLSEFAKQLQQFIKSFRSDNSTANYQKKIQVLISKLLDTENRNLSHFRLFRYQEQKLNSKLLRFVQGDKRKQSLRQEKAESSQQTIQSHQYSRSNYLLPIHPPIPGLNKLLRYWQKNILPKIFQFVKSSLKPMQIEEFFEQMRIPLRKYDQLEAKQVAYVICDNKLPQGAVVPDATFNWNSLTIQQVTVGQDVLIKLPKTKHESPSPLMCSNSQQYRVGQIMFIDQKNSSALVRYRLPQYALFVYSWVPMNSIEKVKQSLSHYSLQAIYRQLQESLEGIIYNYSKICLTGLSSKIKTNIEDLIQQTIIDMFRYNPISGWNSDIQWALRPALKNLLKQGNTKVIDMIQQKFCPIKSYDLDLNSENMIKLNKFDNALGLIVSFKKSSQIIWYSGIKFYADQYGFKQIADTYGNKSCVNQIEPVELKTSNAYCRYYTNKQQFLNITDQNKYAQGEILATIFGVDPIWIISTYLANTIGQIAIEQNKYQDVLTRINKVFLKWIQKRQSFYLCTQLCKVIIKNTLRIKKIYIQKQKQLTIQAVGTTVEQLNSLNKWIEILIAQEEKDMLVLYSPLLQNLIETVASLLSGFEKQNKPVISFATPVLEMIKMIEVIAEIESSLTGKKNKKILLNNDTQWERILLIQNIPSYVTEKDFRQRINPILIKNKSKILTPHFDIFFSQGKAVILVDSWDITELVEEDIIQKIEQEQQKRPEEQDEGQLMEWSCQVCTLTNPVGQLTCSACESPAPKPKVQIQYVKVQKKDVDQAERKLRDKQKSKFENIKQQIKSLFDETWKAQCQQIDKLKQVQQKAKQERRKKKGKIIEVEQKSFVKPEKPNVTLTSGSEVLKKNVIEAFLKKRFESLPQSIRNKVINSQTYLQKFKQLQKLGFDLWGENISSQSPVLLNIECLSQLMQYIQDQICKGSSSVLSYNQSSIRMMSKTQIPLLKQEHEEPMNYNVENSVSVKSKYQRLSEQKSYNIRYSWKIIRELNLAVSKCLPFVNMNIVPNQVKKISSTNTLGVNTKFLRQLIMGALKLQIFKKIIQKTSAFIDETEIPKVALERLKIKDESARGKGLISAKNKDNFLFTKAHEQIQKVSSTYLRSFKPKGTSPFISFVIDFKGEMVQGLGGPYRQFFTDMSAQLHPDSGLNMFVKTPNNIHKTGEGRSKWTINPKANNTYYLSLFHFLGKLMGCCIRTGCHIPIDLANFCWKLIADEKVKNVDMDELDRHFYEQNKQLIECPSQQTFDCMEQAVGEPVTWTYITVDGEQQQLIPDGKNTRVAYQKRMQYVQMMEKRRREQISLQVKNIRQGMFEIIPRAFLNHISGEQLKTIICGVPRVDVDLLRKHTTYSSGQNEETPVNKYFWQMMKQISEQQRLKIIKFCWGQQRLPLNSDEFERNGIRFQIKPMMNKQNPDQALPKADTCFFNIELPQYSSKQIMKARILLAVNLDSTSINADNVMNDDNALLGNVDEDEQGDQYEGGGGG